MRPSQCSQSVVVDQSGTNTAQSFAKGLDEFGTPPDGRLFVAERGGRIGNSTYRRVWAHARETAFTSVMTATLLAKRPYDLRHACVSFSLNARVEATGVAEWGRAQPERASTGLREVHRRRGQRPARSGGAGRRKRHVRDPYPTSARIRYRYPWNTGCRRTRPDRYKIGPVTCFCWSRGRTC